MGSSTLDGQGTHHKLSEIFIFMSITLVSLSLVALITSVIVVSPCIYESHDGDK